MCSRKKHRTNFLFGHQFMNVYQTKLSCGCCITKKKKDDLVDKLKKNIIIIWEGKKKKNEVTNSTR